MNYINYRARMTQLLELNDPIGMYLIKFWNLLNNN